MLDVGPGCGKAQTVERCVGIVNGTQCRFELALAAVIERIADAEDRSPITDRLPAQQVDREGQAIQDGCSTALHFLARTRADRYHMPRYRGVLDEVGPSLA